MGKKDRTRTKEEKEKVKLFYSTLNPFKMRKKSSLYRSECTEKVTKMVQINIEIDHKLNEISQLIDVQKYNNPLVRNLFDLVDLRHKQLKLAMQLLDKVYPID